jgi:hypothetical protein
MLTPFGRSARSRPPVSSRCVPRPLRSAKAAAGRSVTRSSFKPALNSSPAPRRRVQLPDSARPGQGFSFRPTPATRCFGCFAFRSRSASTRTFAHDSRSVLLGLVLQCARACRDRTHHGTVMARRRPRREPAVAGRDRHAGSGACPGRTTDLDRPARLAAFPDDLQSRSRGGHRCRGPRVPGRRVLCARGGLGGNGGLRVAQLDRGDGGTC